MLKQLPPATPPTVGELNACGAYARELTEAKKHLDAAEKYKAEALETVRLHGTQTTPFGRLVLTKSTTAKVPTMEQWERRVQFARNDFAGSCHIFREEFSNLGKAIIFDEWVCNPEKVTLEHCPACFAEALDTQYGRYLLQSAAALAELETFTAYVKSYNELAEWMKPTKETFDNVGVTIKTETPTIKLVSLSPPPSELPKVPKGKAKGKTKAKASA